MSEPSLSMTYIGGPTVLIDVAGMRLLTDPTFDDAGSTYVRGSTLHKLTGPALPASALGRIDAVLLSHHQHADNLDTAGEAVLKKATRVVTTVEGAAASGGNAFGLAPWQSAEMEGPHSRTLRITATPARHGPPERASLAVTGFLLDVFGGIYVSGDTVLYEGVQEVVKRLHPHIAVLHLGAAASVIGAPGLWPWALGAVVLDHALVAGTGLWPRSTWLGPNIRRLPAASARADCSGSVANSAVTVPISTIAAIVT